jgi:hypothetical protein
MLGCTVGRVNGTAFNGNFPMGLGECTYGEVRDMHQLKYPMWQGMLRDAISNLTH